MAENLNRHVKAALFLDAQGYAETDPAAGVSLYGNNEFTLSVQFYAKDLNGRISLAWQEGVFDLGVEDGKPYFQAVGLGEEIQDDGTWVRQETWNTLCVTYDLSKITVYVNGVKRLEAERAASGAPQSLTAAYRFGGTLQGYLQYVHIYERALTAEQVAADQLGGDASASEAALYVNFALKVPADQGKYKKTIRYQSVSGTAANQVCRPVNIVRALTIQNHGVAKAANSAEVCKVLSGGSFTIYAKVHKAGAAGTSVLFACMRDENYGVDLSIRKNGNSIGIGMYFGGDRRSFPEKTIDNLDGWIDVVGVYDQSAKKLQCYANGVLFDSFDDLTITGYTAEVEFGSKLGGQLPFDGCIDSVAIFDAALAAETIAGFEAWPPYLFNDHLAALYSFHDVSPSELVSGSPISLQNGAAVEFCENTQSAPGPAFFYMQNAGASEYSTMHIKMLTIAIDQCLPGLFGVPLAGYGEKVHPHPFGCMAAELLRQNLCSVPEAVKLIDTRGDVSAKELAAFLQAVLSNYQSQEILGIFCPQHAEYITSAAASWGGRAGSLLQGIAKQQLPVLKEIFKELSTPDHTYQLKITSVRFAEDGAFTKESAKSRAIPVNPLTASVWTPANTKDAPSEAVYVASALGDTITATVEFAYATNDGFERTLVLDAVSTGGCLILGNCKASLTVTTSGTYTAQVVFPNHGFGVSGGGGHYNPLSWSATVNGAPASISGADTTYHMLHLIGDFPAEPWDVTDPAKLPPLDGIRIVSRMIAKYGKDIGKLTPPLTAEKMATYATYWMQSCEYFRYDERWDPIPAFVLSFQNETIYSVNFSSVYRKLMEMIEQQKIDAQNAFFPIGHYDVSFLIAGAVRLCGYNLNVVQLSKFAIVNTFAQALSDFPDCRMFDGFHSRKETVDGLKTTWFCANLLFSKQAGNTVGDYTESYYRECFYAKGTECYPIAIFEKWTV